MHGSISRRKFLKGGAAGAMAVGAFGDRHSLAQAAPATLKLTIIDTHTHFYDPTRPQGVPWPARDDKVLYRKVLPMSYKGQRVPQPVTGTVVVEASSWVDD